ncbi:MAG: hypothetical protein ACT4NY_32555 [Pseudonocardiales bacterium]
MRIGAAGASLTAVSGMAAVSELCDRLGVIEGLDAAVTGLGSTTAAGLARRISARQWVAVETGMATVTALRAGSSVRPPAGEVGPNPAGGVGPEQSGKNMTGIRPRSSRRCRSGGSVRPVTPPSTGGGGRVGLLVALALVA